MQVTKIAATTRTDNGKGACRRLRAAGKLPAVSYGKDVATRSLIVDPNDVVNLLNSALGINSVVSLEVEGKAVTAMVTDYQYHPLSRKILHADFIELDDKQTVDVQVPLRLTGKAKGIVMGGKLTTVFRTLPIRSLPHAIPVEIVQDITELELDVPLAVSDLKLPEGVEVLLGEKQTLAVISTDRRQKAEEAAELAADPAAAAKAAAAPGAGASSATK